MKIPDSFLMTLGNIAAEDRSDFENCMHYSALFKAKCKEILKESSIFRMICHPEQQG